MGWVSYSGSYRSHNQEHGQASSASRAAPGWLPADLGTDQGAAPELTDIARMGRRLIRRFVAAARADERATLRSILTQHFGPRVSSLPVVSETWPPYEHVNVQLGLEAWLARAGRSHQLVGLTGFQHRMFNLADLAQDESDGHAPGLGMGSVAMANQPCGPGGRTYPCVQCALYLVEDQGDPLGVLLRGSDSRGPDQNVSLEVLATDPDQASTALDAIRAATFDHNVFRGQVLSFAVEMFGPGQAPITFQERPTLNRESLVLPDGVLESIEEQVVGVAAHRERLLASRQHLKRGLLLHGPPGTGKTHTVRYLISRLPEFTVVILSGNALHYVGAACSIARLLSPAMVVIEDVDLIAEQRGMHPGEHPMLFQLLNEMDGLAEDCDVTFVLTTNRADLLEPALAARPGRIDQAVEFALPDGNARSQLLDLYRGALILDLSEIDAIVARTSGVTASFLKELLRRAAMIAAEQDFGGTGELTVSSAQLSSALDRLLDEQSTMTRALLGAPGGDRAPQGVNAPTPTALPDC